MPPIYIPYCNYIKLYDLMLTSSSVYYTFNLSISIYNALTIIFLYLFPCCLFIDSLAFMGLRSLQDWYEY